MKTLLGCIALVVLCSACQMGKIPCPRVKEAKLRTHYRTTVFSARANQAPIENTQTQRNKDPRVSTTHFVQNVSVSEWDCPRQNRKRYLPKAIKENIRKNMDKVKSEVKKD